jgi:hypothetical protein
MINSLLGMILGCAHKRTTFPLTPSRRLKLSEGARSGTYIVCLDCGKEFDYNWKEMRIGSSVGELPVSPSALQPEQTVSQLNAEGERSEGKVFPSRLITRLPISTKNAVIMDEEAVVPMTMVTQEKPGTLQRGCRLRGSKPADPSHRTRLPARTA